MANPAAVKPGDMGDKGDQGVPQVFRGSMAAAMEQAFNNLLQAEGMKTFDVNTNSREARDRRRLFVAIAQGIVRHLKDNAMALKILDSQNNPTGEQISIQTDPTSF
jgi:hypothetical protein